MYNYFLKFHNYRPGNVEWLEQKTFIEALNYVEEKYGKSWQNMCHLCEYRVVA